jgi:hypothetical protein
MLVNQPCGADPAEIHPPIYRASAPAHPNCGHRCMLWKSSSPYIESEVLCPKGFRTNTTQLFLGVINYLLLIDHSPSSRRSQSHLPIPLA